MDFRPRHADLGDDSAVFHAREECGNDVYLYRKQWQTKGN